MSYQLRAKPIERKRPRYTPDPDGPDTLRRIKLICKQRGIDPDTWADANYGRPTFELRLTELEHMLHSLPTARPEPHRYEYMLEAAAEQELAVPEPPTKKPRTHEDAADIAYEALKRELEKHAPPKPKAPATVVKAAEEPEGSLVEDLGLDVHP